MNRTRLFLDSSQSSIRLPESAFGWVLLIALARLSLHLWVNAHGGYGYFRDELYYLACAQRLDWGYVDHPPGSIWWLAVWSRIAGESLFALRLPPALATAGVVMTSGILTRELGGGRLAQIIAALCSAVSLVGMAFGTIYSMNAFDLLIWSLVAITLVRLLRAATPRLWLALGFLLGLGLLNKVSVLWLAAGVVAAVIVSPLRKWLRTPWPWLGAAAAGVIFAPFVVWNLLHDLAHLEFIRRATAGKYAGLTVARFLAEQPLQQNPATAVVWIVGLVSLVAATRLRRFRPAVLLYAVPLVILLLNRHSKAEYLAAAYVLLFAAGAVVLEAFLSRPGRRWLVMPLLILVASGLALAPAVVPMLSVESYIEWAEGLGLSPSTHERLEVGPLPQFFADMLGWPEKAAAVAAVFHSLPEEERADTGIFANNYGRSAAVDFFGRGLGLPGAIGSHNSYWLWGPGSWDGRTLVVLGGERADLEAEFVSVEEAERVECRYCMPYESDVRIFVARGLRHEPAEVWSRIGHYD